MANILWVAEPARGRPKRYQWHAPSISLLGFGMHNTGSECAHDALGRCVPIEPGHVRLQGLPKVVSPQVPGQLPEVPQ